jgi:hypothetical protein
MEGPVEAETDANHLGEVAQSYLLQLPASCRDD